MILELVGYIIALSLAGYLAMRCFGPIHTVTERTEAKRQQAIEQAKAHSLLLAEYERQRAAGSQVGPPPRMPLKVAILTTFPSAPWS